MGDKVRAMMIRAWIYLKGQRGAQTLEYLGLAILILGILMAAQGLDDGSFSKTLKGKFEEMVKNINTTK